jgi:alpha-beta hydrolase superfamily lysophospholipase
MANMDLPTVEKVPGDMDMQVAFRSWKPTGETKAVVLIVPGFNSHSGYYNWTAHQLADKGYAVYAVDLRGRGASDGERFYVDDIEDYVSDVEKVAAVVAEREAGKKVFILGHSAGGVTACVYTLEHQSELAGLVCESFAYQTPAPDFAIAALKGLAHLAPHAHVLKLDNKDFSRDATVVDAMNADPLIANETQPTRTIAALAMADDRLKQEFPLVNLPVLILHGTADKATKYQGSQFFYDTAGSSDKTLKLYDGHYHDMLNDIGKEEVFGDIAGWLDARA